MGRWLAFLPPILFVALAATFYIGMQRVDPDALPSALIGRGAPDTLPPEAVAGTAPLDSLTEGEVTLVNFWASWCPPCRAEHPNLLAMEAEGLRIVGVNFRDDPGAAAQYLRDDDNPFAATSVDPSGRASLDWGVSAPPETFILAPDGTVLHRYIGPLVGSQYEQQFLPVLREALN
ncbi:MAG: DsbE family thiol:disulfide interchange protein [Pseudomonadota bacterium]